MDRRDAPDISGRRIVARHDLQILSVGQGKSFRFTERCRRTRRARFESSCQRQGELEILRLVPRLAHVVVHTHNARFIIDAPHGVQCLDALRVRVRKESREVPDGQVFAGIHVVGRRGRVRRRRPAQQLIAQPGAGVRQGVTRLVGCLIINGPVGRYGEVDLLPDAARVAVLQHQRLGAEPGGEGHGEGSVPRRERVVDLKRVVALDVGVVLLGHSVLPGALGGEQVAGAQVVDAADRDALALTLGDGQPDRPALRHGDAADVRHGFAVIGTRDPVDHVEGLAVGIQADDHVANARIIDELQVHLGLPHGVEGVRVRALGGDHAVGGVVRDVVAQAALGVEAQQEVLGVLAEQLGIDIQVQRGVALDLLERHALRGDGHRPRAGPGRRTRSRAGVGAQGEVHDLGPAHRVLLALVISLHDDAALAVGMLRLDGEVVALLVELVGKRFIFGVGLGADVVHQPPAPEDVVRGLLFVDHQARGLLEDGGLRAVGVGGAHVRRVAPLAQVAVDDIADALRGGGHLVLRLVIHVISALELPLGDQGQRFGHRGAEVEGHAFAQLVPLAELVVLLVLDPAVSLLGNVFVDPRRQGQGAICLRPVRVRGVYFVVIGLISRGGHVLGRAQVLRQRALVLEAHLHVVIRVVRAQLRRLLGRDGHVLPDGLRPRDHRAVGHVDVGLVHRRLVGLEDHLELDGLPLGVDHLLGGRHGIVKLVFLRARLVLIPADKAIVVGGHGEVIGGLGRPVSVRVGRQGRFKRNALRLVHVLVLIGGR